MFHFNAIVKIPFYLLLVRNIKLHLFIKRIINFSFEKTLFINLNPFYICYITCVMLCYVTYVMLCYITCVTLCYNLTYYCILHRLYNITYDICYNITYDICYIT